MPLPFPNPGRMDNQRSENDILGISNIPPDPYVVDGAGEAREFTINLKALKPSYFRSCEVLPAVLVGNVASSGWLVRVLCIFRPST